MFDLNIEHLQSGNSFLYNVYRMVQTTAMQSILRKRELKSVYGGGEPADREPMGTQEMKKADQTKRADTAHSQKC